MPKQVIQQPSSATDRLNRDNAFSAMTLAQQKKYAIKNPLTARNVLTKVWLDRGGKVHAIKDMKTDYKHNILAHWLSSELKSSPLSTFGEWMLFPQEAWLLSRSYNEFSAIRGIWESMPLSDQHRGIVLLQQKATRLFATQSLIVEQTMLEAFDAI